MRESVKVKTISDRESGREREQTRQAVRGGIRLCSLAKLSSCLSLKASSRCRERKAKSFARAINIVIEALSGA